MKTKRHSAALAFLAAGTLTLTACGTDQNVPAGGGNPALESLRGMRHQAVSGEGSGPRTRWTPSPATTASSARGSGSTTPSPVPARASPPSPPARWTCGSDSAEREKGRRRGPAVRREPRLKHPDGVRPHRHRLQPARRRRLNLNADYRQDLPGADQKWDDPAIKALNPAPSSCRSRSSCSSAPTTRPRRTSRSTRHRRRCLTGEGKQFQAARGVGQPEGSDQVAHSVKPPRAASPT